ncbi:intracellular protein transport protein USO1-like [Nicotiana sylvestris]|uniref:intracellular protein transport protein USO1-like n=1 Tax=Nicotiana sylvestris TaxID=4096 RepID=UPI00388C8B2A
MAEDSELWNIICDGPHVLMKKLEETGPMVPKGRKEYIDIDRKAVEKNYRAKKILMCGIGPDEYNRVSVCDSVKEIWETLQTAHEGTTQVKQSKIDMLTTEYELFRMKDDEFIQYMHTRFTSIINKLHALGDVIPRNKLVRKILSVLPGSWESKVNVITEAKDLQTLTMDELIGIMKTYKIKRKKYSERREPKKEKNLMVRRNGGIPKWDSSGKARNNDLCHKCGKSGHFIKDCPLAKHEQYKQNPDKATKRNLVPNKRFNRKSVDDNIVKQALAAWGDSSSESEREPDAENNSMMAVEIEATKYDSLFALMAQFDDDDKDEDDKVNFRDAQRNLKSYSYKNLRSLANVLIDTYYSLVNDKEILTPELGEVEQSRDDLVVCVVDLNETITNLKKEKEALNERITSVENERDDLMVEVVDLKETIEGLSNEKHSLEGKIATTEEEMDDLLVICTDLEETIEELNREHRNVSLGKGKEVASETHIMFEKELNVVKTSLCSELEKNQQLQAELEKVRIDLEKSLKWTWSSDDITAMYLNNSGNRQGIGFQREKTPYNPHSKLSCEKEEHLWNGSLAMFMPHPLGDKETKLNGHVNN